MAREDAHKTRVVVVYDEDGKQLEQFYFKMNNIRNIGNWIEGFWSLNPLSEALSKKNAFSDIDANAEIDGHSLTLEFKKSLFKMNRGQTMKAVRQARFQRTSTWFIEGDQDNPQYMVQVNSTGVEGELRIEKIVKTDIHHLREQIEKWENWAKKHSLVKGNKTVEWDAVDEVLNNCLEIRK